MSLLDDVSIVVTPNGYKAGELYAVVPVPTEGSEEVVNGDFATDSDWSFGGTTFSAGAILLDSANDNVFQGWADTINTLYKLTITKTGSGIIRFRSGFAGSAATKIEIPESGIIYFTSTSDTNRIQIYADENSINATLNSVSVKEYTAADMDVTRATAATRVDEAGLVNYAEVLGSELVTNGDYTNGLTGWNTQIPSGQTVEVISNQLHINYDSTGTQGSTGVNQSILTVGRIYEVTIDVASLTGTFKVQVGNRAVPITTAGVHTFYETPTNQQILYIVRSSNGVSFDALINSISTKEVTRDNVPRIDYSGGGCPHILAEPQRTNVIEYSEDFSNSYWAKSNANVESNAAVSPDGTQNADKLNFTTSSGEIVKGMAFVSGQTYTMSFYAKTESGTLDFIYGNMDYFTISGTATDEWQRFVITQTLPTTTRFPKIQTTEIGSLLLWGWQVEQGSYATSYIPTSGSTVTRVQDQYSKTGISDKINSEQGVLFVEMAATSLSSNYDVISLSDGTTSNVVGIFYLTNTKSININVKKSGVSVFSGFASTITYPPLDFHKIALKYKTGDFALWIDGTEVLTGIGAFTNLGLSNLQLADGNGTSNNFFGKVKQLQVFKTALTDSELATLTTI